MGTQAPIIATFEPIFKAIDNTEVKSLNIQSKNSEETNGKSSEKVSFAFTRSKQPTENPIVKTLSEEKEDSKETTRPAIRNDHPAAGLFESLLKRQSKPLSRFRYQQYL